MGTHSRADRRFRHYEERWTGNYIFENEWQSLRTRRDRSLELTTVPHDLSPGFPTSPHDILDSERRWQPHPPHPGAASPVLPLPPLVPQLRERVKAFRYSGDADATATSRSLLHWWFIEPHLLPNTDGVLEPFAYFFAQREAIKTILFLVDAAHAQDKFDLLRVDSSGELSANFFDETWLRLLIKMATGSGKTKVVSLVIA